MREAVRIWDFVLIALLLAACCLVLLLPKEEGTLAQVSVDGVLVADQPHALRARHRERHRGTGR